MQYVNVYETDRAYGGPEEGGWYYTVGYPITSIQCATDAELEEARAWCVKRFKTPTSAPDLKIRIENHFAAEYPTERPHYE